MDLWEKSAQRVITSLIFTYSFFVVGIIIFFFGMLSAFQAHLTNPSFGDNFADSEAATFSLVAIIGLLLFIVAMVFGIIYIVRVGQFGKVQRSDRDASIFYNVRLALIINSIVMPIILVIALFALDFDPTDWVYMIYSNLSSIIGLVIVYGLVVIGMNIWIICLFAKYQSSPNIGPNAKTGAMLLMITYILNLASLFIFKITGLVWLCGIASIVLTFIGWTKIKNDNPQLSEAENTDFL